MRKIKILKNAFNEDDMKKQIYYLRFGQPKIQQGLISCRIGNFMKEKFKFRKDIELINQYNNKIKEANKILIKLKKRL